jgi:hypothetical protein
LKGNLPHLAYYADSDGQLLACSHHLLQWAICLTMPTMQIVRGSYLPIASTYSKGLKDLVDMTLRTDPKRRPTVNEVLKTPVLQERIAKFLSATVRSAARYTATRKFVSVANHDCVMVCVLLEGAKFTF